MSRPLRFGLIGCGTIASTQAQSLCSVPGAALTACCDIAPERAHDFAASFGIEPKHAHATLERFLADDSFDAVTVCTPSGTHAELGIAAVRAGRHVIVEKPMDVTLGACDALIEAAQKHDRVLGVISQHRFDPASQWLRQVVDQGGLGRLVLAQAEIKWYRTQDYYDSGDWRGTLAMDGGGALINQGIHTVDLLRWLAGPVKSVSAFTGTMAHEQIEVEDIACAALRFQNGALGTIAASTAAYPGYPATLHLHGTLGSVTLSGDEIASAHFLEDAPSEAPVGQGHGDAVAVAQGGTRAVRAGSSWAWGEAHRVQLADFVQAVRENRLPAVDGAAGRQSLEVVLAVYEAARTGREVTL